MERIFQALMIVDFYGMAPSNQILKRMVVIDPIRPYPSVRYPQSGRIHPENGSFFSQIPKFSHWMLLDEILWGQN